MRAHGGVGTERHGGRSVGGGRGQPGDTTRETASETRAAAVERGCQLIARARPSAIELPNAIDRHAIETANRTAGLGVPGGVLPLSVLGCGVHGLNVSGNSSYQQGFVRHSSVRMHRDYGPNAQSNSRGGAWANRLAVRTRRHRMRSHCARHSSLRNLAQSPRTKVRRELLRIDRWDD